LDEYSRARLLSQIRELADCLAPGDVTGIDVWDWLDDLIQTTNVDAQGPRPGCLFVSPVQSGGHSGRQHTYVLGLDDSRFPGSGIQDPLLLDGERTRVSNDLPTAGGRLARKVQGFAELLSRLRGHVTLGYCCRSLDDERAKFPSSALWSAYRIVSGERQGDQEDLVRWLPDPTVSFAPHAPEGCVDLADWWLWRMCGKEAVADSEAAIAASFPHLGQGMIARRARDSDVFTEYDGYVPEAGPDVDPTKPHGPVLSASRLETLGSCPLGYFMQYVLEIEPPQEYEIDPAIWLDPAERGGLLHAVFREFMEQLQQTGLVPQASRDADLLRQVLEKHIAFWREEKPPANPDVFARECQDLNRVGRIFLDEEERYCRANRPFCFEASIGLPQDESQTVLDVADPVAIVLPSGAVIRARGRIDRVDELGGTAGRRFAIWDYKTGSAWGFDRRDPFRQGRRIQAALYLELAQARLCELDPSSSVMSCGYFFPNLREHGERISWGAATLAEGKAVIGALCEMIAGGCFPFSDSADDVRFSDYLAAFGDPAAAAQATARKLANPANEALAPFRRLRESGGG
jgi:ATP-dependent helicase/nuclease subunit B